MNLRTEAHRPASTASGRAGNIIRNGRFPTPEERRR